VLVYLGNLGIFFDAASSAICEGGLLVVTVEALETSRLKIPHSFDVEEANAKGWRLLTTGRFAHSEEYVRASAIKSHFDAEMVKTLVMGFEDGERVDGYLFVFRKRWEIV
jgi:predicted TPR repeat methyltransferase